MTILVLGAAGLIGNFVAGEMVRRGVPVAAVARRFNRAQHAQLGAAAREIPVAQCDVNALRQLMDKNEADVVVNCLGVLQDGPADSTRDIHLEFVERLIAAIRAAARPILLVHLSIPGIANDDRTAFARTKRDAEQAIAQSGLPYAILRPGFVIAPAAFGGSAMLRALAALPFDLPARLGSRPCAFVAIEDIARTVHLLAERWPASDRKSAVTWDLMHPDQRSLGDAVASLRAWLGMESMWRTAPPMILLKLGALAGDFASWLGWRPPLRSTALAELERGVAGDPRAWLAATKIEPRALDDVLRLQPASVQEKWFARLYALKALILTTLVIFWCASALIALTVAFVPAVGILTSHGYAAGPARIMTIGGSIMDFSIGVAIAFRRTSRWGLWAGIAVSLFYMLGAAILTPDLWIEPLGALVKTFPAIVLMLVALAIGDER
jgi:uncharacterized protein YbjT (DUF2867 family)